MILYIRDENPAHVPPVRDMTLASLTDSGRWTEINPWTGGLLHVSVHWDRRKSQMGRSNRPRRPLGISMGGRFAMIFRMKDRNWMALPSCCAAEPAGELSGETIVSSVISECSGITENFPGRTLFPFDCSVRGQEGRPAVPGRNWRTGSVACGTEI